MQTHLSPAIKATAAGREANAILRTCVHCGFCTATCPTYQLLGDELDGPRGRIYLIKSVLEGSDVSRATQRHLDRCLTCRACETTCPSGVAYGRLLEIGRAEVESRQLRTPFERLQRRVLRSLLAWPGRFGLLLGLGRWLRPLLPARLRANVPLAQSAGHWPDTAHDRTMLVLAGCVQPAIAPRTNAAAARVLDRLGIRLLSVDASGCCGAVSLHLGAEDEAKGFMRRNIDAWWPHIEAGAEAIVMTASGCGVTVREYAVLLADDPGYADKAARISALCRDLSEVLADELLADAGRSAADVPGLQRDRYKRVAFHPPCTLQHGQKITGVVESLLTAAGFSLCAVPDSHLCCGSAGTYSILQGDIATRLRDNKLQALSSGRPDVIVTANIGCQTWLDQQSGIPVRHWIELFDAG